MHRLSPASRCRQSPARRGGWRNREGTQGGRPRGGLPQCIRRSCIFSFTQSQASGHPRYRRHGARPEHKAVKATGSCPQGVFRSDKPGRAPPLPRGLVLWKRWQDAQREPGAHTEDQGSALFPLGKAESPPSPQLLCRPRWRPSVICHSASGPDLRIK